MATDTQIQPTDIALDATAFAAIIGTYVDLKGGTEAPRGYCPLCHSDGYHFVLNPNKLEWRCQHCHEHGDIYRFFEKIRHTSPEEAKRFADIMIAAEMRKERKQSQTLDASRVIFSGSNKNREKTSTPAVRETPAAAKTADAGDPEAFKKKLLSLFNGRNGYLGLALVDKHNSVFKAPSLEYLDEKDLQTLDAFFTASLSDAQKFMPTNINHFGDTRFALEFTLKTEPLKLLWIPASHPEQIGNILLLLQQDTPEGLYLLQLKKHFSHPHPE